jgi:hypothetical protein
MNELFLIVGSACLGFSFAEVSMIPQMFSRFLLSEFNIGNKLNGYQYAKTPLRLKPFDCGYCLSFWVALLSALYFNYIIITALMIGFAASIVAILFKKFI